MFVTLLQDVKGLGKKTERVRVSDAYARNVLIPRKLAAVGEQSEHRLTPKKSEAESMSHEDVSAALAAPFEFTSEANEQGGLYAKIDEKTVLTQAAQRLKIPLTLLELKDFEVVKKIGEYDSKVMVNKKAYPIHLIVKAK